MTEPRYLIAALGALIAGPAAADCGPTPGPCILDDGEYHIALPDSPAEGPVPAILYLHGAGSHGAAVMRNTGLVDSVTDRGYALIAPTGSRGFGSGEGRLWAFIPDFGDGRDETDFLARVSADAGARFGIDPDRTMLSGFSAGGFMVTYIACDTPDAFPAYAPIAGGFWRPHPDRCAGPVKLHHTHGWTDATVPLEGRYLRNGQWQQGDIFAGLEIFRASNACPTETADSFDMTEPFWRRSWTVCADGSALELALHPGGHMIPPGWADMAIDWFEAHMPES
ncbi:alpha/beta hydrolase family esterase [Chachezhania antarctica]|uniref:alpha/beta hydrolase family esterase n=1 Tax=Chachezhania antarctica TaxID=2340860 RepID=UPI000EAE862A|nr:prolyl oligopeptidase family serine peptidase [Chachezhania antarctica]